MNRKIHSYEDIEHIANNVIRLNKDRMKDGHLDELEYSAAKIAIYELLDEIYQVSNEDE